MSRLFDFSKYYYLKYLCEGREKELCGVEEDNVFSRILERKAIILVDLHSDLVREEVT